MNHMQADPWDSAKKQAVRWSLRGVQDNPRLQPVREGLEQALEGHAVLVLARFAASERHPRQIINSMASCRQLGYRIRRWGSSAEYSPKDLPPE
jgi:hypothetical protein